MSRVASTSVAKAAFCATFMFVLSFAASADVFKFVDEKGNVQYTDRPQKLPAQRLDIQTQRTDVLELESRTEAEMKAMADRAKAREATQQAGADRQKAAETNSASKAEACAKAREDYRVRATNYRLYEEGANGERRYLDSAQVDAARDAAKRTMDDLCAGL